ncbi:MAG: HypC/HybG/HupF family hydrogenase formation chaperone [Candidatus Omnitrophica bacterium]|nr:HypC/HybG/HupF family hydrogenase formation chaperone [Candidatus Omnitrophota bacterium]
MCLAVPMKVTAIKGNTATAEFGTVMREVNIELLEDVRKGDYIIVHAGVAIEKLDEDEAERMLELLGTLEK